ncbi:MAG: hypothetical protein V4443_00815 [Pseudomonadota bacterium]
MAENLMLAGYGKLRGNAVCAISARRISVARRVVAGLWACALPVCAWALADPTQPPGPSAQSVAIESNRLQTVIISPLRRAAIIDGQMVELGAKHGDVRLIEVSEGGVVLSGENGRTILHLFPGIEISKKTAPLAVPKDLSAVSLKQKQVDSSARRAEKKEWK